MVLVAIQSNNVALLQFPTLYLEILLGVGYTVEATKCLPLLFYIWRFDLEFISF